MQLKNLKVLKNKLKYIKARLDFLLIAHPKLSAFVLGLCLKNSFNKSEQFIWLLIAIPTLLHILEINCKNKVFTVGYWFGYGYFLSTLCWIAQSFKCVGMGNLGYFAVILLVAYLALFPALTCYLSNKFNSIITQRVSFAVFWTIFEILRGYLFTGFPWNLVGYVTYKIPYFAQIADLVTVYGVSFFLLLILVLLTKKTYKYSIILTVIIAGYGFYKIELCSEKTKETLNISIVQPAISQQSKFDPKNFWDNLDLHIALSAFGSNKKRLIIWAESAVGTTFDPYLMQYVTSQMGKNEILITGIDRIENEKIYNSAIAINNKSEFLQVYDKKHLVPFGEYIPKWVSKLGPKKLTKGMENFTKGNLSKTFNLPGIPLFEVNICYEIIFPRKVISSKSSKWILTISNDAWFGNTDAPYQHIKTACFRAIEERKPVVRCANNGISCIFNKKGEIVKMLDTDTIGRIDYELHL